MSLSYIRIVWGLILSMLFMPLLTFGQVPTVKYFQYANNTEETLVVSSPSQNMTIETGESVVFKWKLTAPTNAYIPDPDFGIIAQSSIFNTTHIILPTGSNKSNCSVTKTSNTNTYSCSFEWFPDTTQIIGTYNIRIFTKGNGTEGIAPGSLTIKTKSASVSITNPSHNIKVSVGDTVPIRWTTKIPISFNDQTPYASISLINESTKNSTTLVLDRNTYTKTTNDQHYTLYMGEYNWKPDASHLNSTYRVNIWHKAVGPDATSNATITVVSGTNTPSKTHPPVITPKPINPVVSDTNEAVLKAQLAIYVQLLKALVELLVAQGGIDRGSANQILAPFVNY